MTHPVKIALCLALGALLYGWPSAPAQTNALPRAGQTRGTIQEVDLAAKRLILQTDKGLWTFAYTAASRVFRDQEKITFDKLKPGDRIALSWYRDAAGQVTINRLKFALPPEEP